MHVKTGFGKTVLSILLIFAGVAGAQSCRAADEVTMSGEDFKKLDNFEAHQLSQADKTFAAKDFKRAITEYDAFVLEFPKSTGAPYALLRKARSLHLNNKRFDAMKIYAQVLDDYPADINAAVPALYYSGLCHVENGEPEKATKAWSQMATDAAYRKHPIAAATINNLCEILAQQGKGEQAAVFEQQVAEDFRKNNPEQARIAIERVVNYCIVNLNEPRLRAFYTQVRTFEGDPQPLKGNVEENSNYWQRTIEAIHRYGNFPPDQSDKQDAFYRYWSSAMAGKMADWDDFQIERINFQRNADKDTGKWIEQLDKQFAAGATTDQTRVIRWIKALGSNKDKVKEYYTKLDFAKLDNAKLQELIQAVYDEVKDKELGGSLVSKLKLADMPDNQKQWLAQFLSPRDPERVIDICQQMTDKDFGKAVLLGHYWERRDYKRGVALADDLVGVPAHAKQSYFIKGLLLEDSKQFEKAVTAYQLADRPPETLWRISDCYFNAGKLEQAVAQLREVENFFKEHAPEAAMRIAHLYQRANQKDKYRMALRLVLKKYPESQQSSQAHQESNAIDASNGGGVNADQN